MCGQCDGQGLFFSISQDGQFDILAGFGVLHEGLQIIEIGDGIAIDGSNHVSANQHTLSIDQHRLETAL